MNVLFEEHVYVSQHPCQDTHVRQYSDVWLDCEGSNQENLRWKHQDRSLYWGRRQVAGSTTYPIQLLHNYTLILENVTYKNEGLYYCVEINKTLKEYCLIVHGKFSYFGVIDRNLQIVFPSKLTSKDS